VLDEECAGRSKIYQARRFAENSSSSYKTMSCILCSVPVMLMSNFCINVLEAAQWWSEDVWYSIFCDLARDSDLSYDVLDLADVAKTSWLRIPFCDASFPLFLVGVQ